MGATEEHIALLSAQGVTHVSYILLIFSAAFLLFLFVCVLLHLYAQAAWPLDASGRRRREGASGSKGNGIKLPDTPVGAKKGRKRRGGSEEDLERAKGVEELELEGLMSDDDDEAEEGGDDGGGQRGERRGEGSTAGSSNGSSTGSSSEDSGSGRRKELVGV